MPTPRKVKQAVGQHNPLIIKPEIMYSMKLTKDSYHWSRTESVTTKQRACDCPSPLGERIMNTME